MRLWTKRLRHFIALATVSAFPLGLSAQEVILNSEEAVDVVTGSTPPPSQASDAANQAAIAVMQAITTPQQPQGRTIKRHPPRRVVPTTFVLRDITFTPSQYLTRQQLAAIEAKLVGSRYSRGALTAIAGEISKLYAQQGIFTAQALVRDVNFARGILNIELLEARVGQVNYQSNSLSREYLAYRLNINSGDMADNRDLENQLSAFQMTDGVELQAGYAPGNAHGLTDITVLAPDIPKHVTTGTIDNYGSPSTGKAQLTLSHTINNLTGWNDPLSFSYSHREGSGALSLNYRRVISPRGVAVNFSLAGSRSSTLSTPSASGKLRSASIGIYYPAIMKTSRQLSFGGAVSFFHETSDLLGVRTLDHNGREISLEMSTVNKGDNWSLTSTFGFMAGKYDNAVTPLNGIRYSAATLRASYARSLGPDIFVTLSIGAQHSLNGVMPSTRQFTVTAPNAVRGYPTSLSSGSSGYFARLQLEKSTAFLVGNGKVGLRPFAFLDAGEAYDSTRVGLGFASSVGIGMSITTSNAVFGDIYIAKPLTTGITGWATPSKNPVIGGSLSIRF